MGKLGDPEKDGCVPVCYSLMVVSSFLYFFDSPLPSLPPLSHPSRPSQIFVSSLISVSSLLLPLSILSLLSHVIQPSPTCTCMSFFFLLLLSLCLSSDTLLSVTHLNLLFSSFSSSKLPFLLHLVGMYH